MSSTHNDPDRIIELVEHIHWLSEPARQQRADYRRERERAEAELVRLRAAEYARQQLRTPPSTITKISTTLQEIAIRCDQGDPSLDDLDTFGQLLQPLPSAEQVRWYRELARVAYGAWLTREARLARQHKKKGNERK